MPFCGKCGTQMSDSDAFCPSCGTPAGAVAAQDIPQPVPQNYDQPQQPYAPQQPYQPAPAGDNFFSKLIAGMKNNYYIFGRSIFDLKMKIVALAGFILGIILQFIPTMSAKLGITGKLSDSERKEVKEAFYYTSARGFHVKVAEELFSTGILSFFYFLFIAGSWALLVFALLHVTSYKQDVYLFYKRMGFALLLRVIPAGFTFFICMLASGKVDASQYLSMNLLHFLFWGGTLALCIICFARGKTTKNWKSYSASLIRRIEEDGEIREIDNYPYVEDLYIDDKTGQLYQLIGGNRFRRKSDGREFDILKPNK